MDTSAEVVIFHGTGSRPSKNWFPCLASQLQAKGVRAMLPVFPTPEGQSLKNWKSAFLQQVGLLNEEMILVGHSIGCAMILRLLEESSCSVRATFLVSGWTGMLGNAQFDPLIESFFEDPFDWNGIKTKAGVLRMYHGDNDPYVPLALGESLAEKLSSQLTVIPNGGHLNQEAGVEEFVLLLVDILGVLNSETQAISIASP